MKFRTVFGKDYIRIESQDGIEAAIWTQDEWVEDPQVVMSIVNAVIASIKAPHRFAEVNRKHILDSAKLSGLPMPEFEPLVNPLVCFKCGNEVEISSCRMYNIVGLTSTRIARHDGMLIDIQAGDMLVGDGRISFDWADETYYCGHCKVDYCAYDGNVVRQSAYKIKVA